MHLHAQKPRDMARSALASNWSHGARAERRETHRAHRRHANQQLHMLCRHVDPLDYEDELLVDDHRMIGEMAGYRRVWDRLGPLLAWAERRIANDPRLAALDPIDQVQHFRRLLPDTTAGRHALDHIAASVICDLWTWPDGC